MRKINFEIVFKIIVLTQLTLILIFLFFSKEQNENLYNFQQNSESNEIGRYKEIKIKKTVYGNEREEVLILDTETGETKHP